MLSQSASPEREEALTAKCWGPSYAAAFDPPVINLTHSSSTWWPPRLGSLSIIVGEKAEERRGKERRGEEIRREERGGLERKGLEKKGEEWKERKGWKGRGGGKQRKGKETKGEEKREEERTGETRSKTRVDK